MKLETIETSCHLNPFFQKGWLLPGDASKASKPGAGKRGHFKEFLLFWLDFPLSPAIIANQKKTSQISAHVIRFAMICLFLWLQLMASQQMWQLMVSPFHPKPPSDFAPGSWIGNRSRGEATDEEGRSIGDLKAWEKST